MKSSGSSSNSQIAAEGRYQDGVEVGEWRFWDANGKPGDIVSY
jgi:antitoxin component YwqK of YwqJK toxin-antitoxin module